MVNRMYFMLTLQRHSRACTPVVFSAYLGRDMKPVLLVAYLLYDLRFYKMIQCARAFG